MPKCTNCNKNIDCLINVQSAIVFCEMDKTGSYHQNNIEPDNNINEWVCPECSETIAVSEEEALKFLNKR